MKTCTDAEMNELLPAAKANCVVIPKQSPNFADDTAPTIIWEHGRRNFGLRHDGVLPAVLPVTDGSEMCGVGIFTGAVDDTIAAMNDDPGVQAGAFTFEVHPFASYPQPRGAQRAGQVVVAPPLSSCRRMSSRTPCARRCG